jgi:peroxiredoxin
MRREVNICSQFGDESKILEVVRTDLNGGFSFSFDNQEVGLYRIYLDTQDSFDIIFNNEDVEIRTKIENPQYNVKVIRSVENIQLYSYIVQNYVFDYKIDVLTQLAEIYPDGKFRRKAEVELAKEISLKNKNLDKVIRKDSKSFAGRYLSYFKELPVSSKFNEYERIEFLKENYLKSFVFSDVALINSDAYTNVVLNYFKLFKSNNTEIYYNAGKEILDYVFFEDPKIFSFLFEYILTGFESLELDEPAAKLSLEYGDVCSDDNESLKLRIKSNTLLSKGKKAPDFSAKTISGEDFVLSEMKGDYTLIIFWATWCEHCQITMPRLAAAGNIFKEAKMDIVAVSIDSDEAVLKSFLIENQMPWNIICDFKGWDSQVVLDYAIYATPSMYLIDKDMNIVAKPFNEEKLYNELEKILTQ